MVENMNRATEGSLYFCIGLIAVILLISVPEEVEGFDTGKYCRLLCKKGKGGNLCKCSAVHFAGKRVREDDGDFIDDLEDDLGFEGQALNGYGSVLDEVYKWDTAKDRAQANR